MFSDINTIVTINPQLVWGMGIGLIIVLISSLFLWLKHFGTVWLIVGFELLLASLYCLLIIDAGLDSWIVYPIALVVAGVTIYLVNILFIQPFETPYDFKPDQIIGHVGITNSESDASDEGTLTLVVGTETVELPYRLGVENAQDAIKLIKGVQVLILDYIDGYAYVIPMDEKDIVYLDEAN